MTPFATSYGGSLGLGEVANSGVDDLLAGAGRDPSADSTGLRVHLLGHQSESASGDLDRIPRPQFRSEPRRGRSRVLTRPQDETSREGVGTHRPKAALRERRGPQPRERFSGSSIETRVRSLARDLSSSTLLPQPLDAALHDLSNSRSPSHRSPCGVNPLSRPCAEMNHRLVAEELPDLSLDGQVPSSPWLKSLFAPDGSSPPLTLFRKLRIQQGMRRFRAASATPNSSSAIERTLATGCQGFGTSSRRSSTGNFRTSQTSSKKGFWG